MNFFFLSLKKKSESARVKMSVPLKKSSLHEKKKLFPKFYFATSLSAKPISLKQRGNPLYCFRRWPEHQPPGSPYFLFSYHQGKSHHIDFAQKGGSNLRGRQAGYFSRPFTLFFNYFSVYFFPYMLKNRKQSWYGQLL